MSTATEPQFDKLSGHNYDGIQEYDNPMPGWWVAIFIATIIWAVGYWAYYHSGVPDRSVVDDYTEAQTADVRRRFAGMGELQPTEQNLINWTQNSEYMLIGQSVFKANCISCHGTDGSGKVGPNLTDEYARNIKRVTDIPRVITGGAANGSMPAWGNRLHPNEIALVASYVASLRGKNLPGPQVTGPLGEKMPDWPKPTATPTTNK